jgi:hypothetical protein
MRRPGWAGAAALAVLVGLVVAVGCPKSSGPVNPPGGSPPDATPSPIKVIMKKLTGPGSLTPLLGRELEAEEPAWETIQPQTKEFVKLATELGTHQPPKGAPDSWAKFTGAYAESAAALDKAAEARDRKAALSAHGQLRGSCTACHRQHKGP